MTKKTKLGLIVAATLGLGALSQSVQAVNVAPNGIGELLYIPYYAAKDGKHNQVRLVNNSHDTIAVKFKVREGTSSQDARDFHIFMSPRDVWTATVYEENGEVRIATTDNSCTVPSKDRGWLTGGSVGTWYIGVPALGNTGSKEGYIVAQVMGVSESNVFSPYDNDSDVASLAKHSTDNDGDANTPRNCGAISFAFDLNTDDNTIKNPAAYASVRSQFTEPMNVLSAASAIVNPANGTLTDLPITVLANVYNPGLSGQDGDSGYAESGANDFPNDTISIASDDFPDENTVSPNVAVIFDDLTATTTTLNSLDSLSVSSALMRSSVNNNFDTTGENSWIVTFPTKKHHLGSPCSTPFPADCSPNITSIQHTVHDKGSSVSYVTNEEESEFTTPDGNQICFSGPDFSQSCPLDSNPNVISLPTEVNVVNMGTGNSLNSQLATTINSDFLGNIVYGWMQMRFTDANPISGTNAVTGDATTLYGLPVIGFSYTEYAHSGLSATMSQPHTYTSPLRR